MVIFERLPYRRPQWERLSQQITEGVKQFQDAPCWEDAYFSLLELDAPRRLFMTMAVLCEAHNTGDTNDAFWAEESAWFDDVRPQFDALNARLGSALCASPWRKELEEQLGGEIFRRADVTARAFSEQVVADIQEEGRLSAAYSRVTANLAVEVDGVRRGLGELSALQTQHTRAERAKLDLLRQQAFAEASPELDRLYDELTRVRTRIAQKLGASSFTEIGYARQARTSYGRDEAARFRAAIAAEITPLVAEIYTHQKHRMGFDTLWSYDEDADFPGAAPKPRSDDLLGLFEGIFSALSPETDVFYRELCRWRFFDLDNRPGKIRGAYSNHFPLYRLPFIFETFDGSPSAIKTFAHECGHGLHSFLKRGEPFVDSCEACNDVSEIHSMSMEFFIWPYLDRIYNEKDAARYRMLHMKNALAFLPYGAAVDAFQTHIYDEPDLTPAQRLELWRSIEAHYLPWRRYQPGGFLDQGRAWQRQTHIYKWPFYYIDYALAQTCALQFLFMDETDHAAAWRCYLELLRQSGRFGFHDTLWQAGLQSPFEPASIRDIGLRAQALLNQMNEVIG